MNAKWLRALSLAALLFAAPSIAAAKEGWYGRADVGYSIDASLDGDVDGDELKTDLEGDWMGGLGLGYAFQNGLRVEGEVGHRFNQLEALPNLDGGGDIHAWSAMLNFFYDFNRASRVSPRLIGPPGSRP